MQLDRPFRVVTPTVDGDVLAVLARAEEEFTPPEVHRLVGDHSEEGVRKALQRLAGQGIVLHRRAGNAVLYQLNREHLAAPAVYELASLKSELLSRLRERIESWAAAPRFAALFGSAAGGQMRLDSDIDIFVVRPDRIGVDEGRWRDQIDALQNDARRWVGNDVRVLEYADREVADGLGAGDRVLLDIADGGIYLAGPRRYLTRARDERA